jgi:acyl-CoA synthetase (AMP-forming)/AMP-acid ligase II
VEVLSTEDVSAHRLLVAAPMFHMNALFNLKFAFHNNATVVLAPLFSVAAYIAAIEAHNVTWLTSVPTMIAMVAKEIGDGPAPPSFKNVTRIYMGSSPFGQSLLDRVRKLFPNAVVSNGYGTTEAGPAVFGKHPDGLATPDLSMGYPLKAIDLRIVDGEGRPVEGEGEGVLQMRTPALMSGYLHLPEQTARAVRDGWYHTNDVVRRDANGFYFFVGRADDMFVSGGENIYPGEVEKLIERYPGVQQAVVVPVPDDIKQTLPFAFVVREPGAGGEKTTEDGIKKWTLESGPAYQHPRWVEFVDAMPLAGTNKIDRAALKLRAKDIAGAGRR